MATRFNSKSIPRFGVSGLHSGYDNNVSNVAFYLPSAGIEDVDVALFKLFDDQIALTVNTSDGNKVENRRVPVIFAASEKWALSKKNKPGVQPVRDRNGSLILPLTTIVRTSVKQDVEDITGRGINQQTGELTVRRRLDSSDRALQNIFNRLMVKNQSNVAVSPEVTGEGLLTTLEDVGDRSEEPTVVDGGLLAPELSKNAYETIVFPVPQFFTATYEVTLWAQYTVQMNQMIEHLVASFLPQGQSWKLESAKGYWYIASIDGNLYTSETNVDDMSAEERMIKYKFTINVPGYIFATSVPGAPVPVKRYLSQPSISFDVGACNGESSVGDTVDDPFLGSDDPTLPLANGKSRRRDQRDPGDTRLYTSGETIGPHDPARNAIPRGQPLARYVKIVTTNAGGKPVVRYLRAAATNRFTGETSFLGVDLGGIDQIAFADLPATVGLLEFTDEFTDEFL